MGFLLLVLSFFPQVSLELSKLFMTRIGVFFSPQPPPFSVESDSFDPKELEDEVNQSQLPAVLLNFSRLLGSVGTQFVLQNP